MSKGYIYKDVDNDGNIKLPVTHSDAVYFSDGDTLTDKSQVHREYVTVASSPMTAADTSLFTTEGSWSYSANGATPSAIGSSTYIRCKNIYHCDMRVMRIKALLGTDTKLMCPSYASNPLGTSCFSVDMANKTINIYPALPYGASPGYGDNMRQTSGFDTSVALTSAPIPDDMIGNREYIVEIERNVETHIIRLYDTLTAKMVEVSHEGWAAGCQNEQYQFYCESGTLPTLSDFSVRTLNEPDIVFVGDSITEGAWCINRLETYANRFRKRFPSLKVMVSAKSGSQLSLHTDKWSTEFNLYKPKIISLLIGWNGGNTQNAFNTWATNCNNIGCRLIVHHVNGKSEINDNLDSWGVFNGAYFDIATSLNNDPDQGKNPAYYENGSGAHPNGDGHKAMFDRLVVDCPDLWYNS